MKFIDLFAGVGGFHYGIKKAIKESGKSGQVGNGRQSSNIARNGKNEQCPSCIYSNEWDKYANSVYRKHFGECDNRDIRTVAAESIPDHDLLCGGFPCQSFSIAGKRGGFNDTRGTLFFEIARILKAKRPRLCLLENVKGLLSHDSGRTFKTIISTLTELGYDCQWQVLNSKDFGVPQNRERVFIIGHIRGTARPKVFPIIGSNKETKNLVYAQKSDKEIARIYDSMGLSPTLHLKTGGWQEPKIIHPTIDANYYKFYSHQRKMIDDNTKIRRLTPIECERLQGFPDNWTKYGADGELISDTQRYKMMGNAVTTNVITEIAKHL